MGVVLFLFGVYDWQVVMTGSSYYIGQVYGIMFTWCMLFLPSLTMKMLSEERKNKTDQALITAPVSVTAIVWGKFLAAFSVYLFTMLITLIPAFIIGLFSSPTWSHIFRQPGRLSAVRRGDSRDRRIHFLAHGEPDRRPGRHGRRQHPAHADRFLRQHV